MCNLDLRSMRQSYLCIISSYFARYQIYVLYEVVLWKKENDLSKISDPPKSAKVSEISKIISDFYNAKLIGIPQNLSKTVLIQNIHNMLYNIISKV